MKQTLFFCLFIFLFSIGTQAQRIRIKTGIEVLKDHNFNCLKGKRVGLITNPTGVDNNLKSTVDILYNAPNVKLVALYGPEHGVRGSAHAGAKVNSEKKDPGTGLPVYSLYGKNRMPTADMLKDVDVLVYDIQDIGCRSYTFISTLGNVMKAAAKYNKELIVLDRPDPLGGEKIEGNITEDDCISFVSQFRIPYIYGLTPGELALLFNGESMLTNTPCNLKIIRMKGWKRRMTYDQTGLQWVPSSPHIPQAGTALFYAVSGIVGELGDISIGVGYTIPFQLFGATWINAKNLADNLNQLELPGILFRPIYFTPFYAIGKEKSMQGVQVYIVNYKKARLCEIQFYVMQEISKLYPDHSILEHANDGRLSMFDKVCGSKQVRKLFIQKDQWKDVAAFWNKDADSFRNLARKYYLYRK